MGNQQERRELADLYWFGGVWDGEGSIILGANMTFANKKPIIAPQIRFTNTSAEMIQMVTETMRAHEVPFHIASRPPTTGSKTIWNISVNGMKRAARWLDVFESYLRVKRPQAELVRKFITSRMAKDQGTPYSEEELGWYVQMRQMHGYRTHESPEAICQAIRARRGCEDMVRPHAKA